MRLVSLLVLASISAATAGGPVIADTYATGFGPCKSTFAKPGAETPSQLAALDLLGSFTQLEAPLGRRVLVSNFATTIAINNQASPEARAQALKDAQITDFNAFALADGLGEAMTTIYRNKAGFGSDTDGRTTQCGEVGPHVTTFIAAANALSGSDSNAGKFGFANGMNGRYPLLPGGAYDVLGKAYGFPANTPGSSKFGDPRPFLTAPLDGVAGPHIATYEGQDFFGASVNTRTVLTGSADPKVVGSALTQSPAFPSGHTTFGFSESLVLAMMVPERLRALAYRASEYGDSRIVLGAHYAVDVIAGRTLATYDLAQDLAGRPNYATVDGKSFRTGLAAAAGELRVYLKAHGCPSIAACAATPITRAANATAFDDMRLRIASPGASYAFRLNYGLAPMSATSLPPEPVPEAAAFLLQSRFPYLDAAQRREILRTTEGPSGHFLDVSPLDGRPVGEIAKGPAAEAGVYARLNLFAAAGGYATFADQVTINQDPAAITDPDLTPFADLARADVWSNDISGPGGLTKQGVGALILSGRSTYLGPTVVGGGILEVDGSVTSPVTVEAAGTLAGGGKLADIAIAAGGTLAPGSATGEGALEVEGSLKLDKRATVSVRRMSSGPKIRIAGKATLDDAALDIETGAGLARGLRFKVLEAAGGVSGTFAEVRVKAPDLVPSLAYTATAVYVTMEAPTAR